MTVDPGRVAALRDEGLSLRQIAQKLGASKSTIGRLMGDAAQHDVPTRGPDSARSAPTDPASRTPGTGIGAYTATDIRTGVTAVAAANGNTVKAAKWLADAGRPIPEGVLREWRDRLHRDEYLQARRELAPQLKEAQAIAAEDVAAQAASVSHEALSRLSRELDDVKTERLAGVAKDAQVAFGISSEKAAFWRGQPERITEHRTSDAAEIYDELKERYPGLFIDGHAEPDDPPELPPAA